MDFKGILVSCKCDSSGREDMWDTQHNSVNRQKSEQCTEQQFISMDLLLGEPPPRPTSSCGGHWASVH